MGPTNAALIQYLKDPSEENRRTLISVLVEGLRSGKDIVLLDAVYVRPGKGGRFELTVDGREGTAKIEYLDSDNPTISIHRSGLDAEWANQIVESVDKVKRDIEETVDKVKRDIEETIGDGDGDGDGEGEGEGDGDAEWLMSDGTVWTVPS